MLGSLHEWIVAIATTILGTVLGVVATRVDSYLEVRKRPDLKGDWLSISDAAEHDGVRRRIEISTWTGSYNSEIWPSPMDMNTRHSVA